MQQLLLKLFDQVDELTLHDEVAPRACELLRLIFDEEGYLLDPSLMEQILNVEHPLFDYLCPFIVEMNRNLELDPDLFQRMLLRYNYFHAACCCLFIISKTKKIEIDTALLFWSQPQPEFEMVSNGCSTALLDQVAYDVLVMLSIFSKKKSNLFLKPSILITLAHLDPELQLMMLDSNDEICTLGLKHIEMDDETLCWMLKTGLFRKNIRLLCAQLCCEYIKLVGFDIIYSYQLCLGADPKCVLLILSALEPNLKGVVCALLACHNSNPLVSQFAADFLVKWCNNHVSETILGAMVSSDYVEVATQEYAYFKDVPGHVSSLLSNVKDSLKSLMLLSQNVHYADLLCPHVPMFLEQWFESDVQDSIYLLTIIMNIFIAKNMSLMEAASLFTEVGFQHSLSCIENMDIRFQISRFTLLKHELKIEKRKPREIYPELLKLYQQTHILKRFPITSHEELLFFVHYLRLVCCVPDSARVLFKFDYLDRFLTTVPGSEEDVEAQGLLFQFFSNFVHYEESKKLVQMTLCALDVRLVPYLMETKNLFLMKQILAFLTPLDLDQRMISFFKLCMDQKLYKELFKCLKNKPIQKPWIVGGCIDALESNLKSIVDAAAECLLSQELPWPNLDFVPNLMDKNPYMAWAVLAYCAEEYQKTISLMFDDVMQLCVSHLQKYITAFLFYNLNKPIKTNLVLEIFFEWTKKQQPEQIYIILCETLMTNALKSIDFLSSRHLEEVLVISKNIKSKEFDSRAAHYFYTAVKHDLNLFAGCWDFFLDFVKTSHLNIALSQIIMFLFNSDYRIDNLIKVRELEWIEFVAMNPKETLVLILHLTNVIHKYHDNPNVRNLIISLSSMLLNTEYRQFQTLVALILQKLQSIHQIDYTQTLFSVLESNDAELETIKILASLSKHKKIINHNRIHCILTEGINQHMDESPLSLFPFVYNEFSKSTIINDLFFEFKKASCSRPDLVSALRYLSQYKSVRNMAIQAKFFQDIMVHLDRKNVSDVIVDEVLEVLKWFSYYPEVQRHMNSFLFLLLDISQHRFKKLFVLRNLTYCKENKIKITNDCKDVDFFIAFKEMDLKTKYICLCFLWVLGYQNHKFMFKKQVYAALRSCFLVPMLPLHKCQCEQVLDENIDKVCDEDVIQVARILMHLFKPTEVFNP